MICVFFFVIGSLAYLLPILAGSPFDTRCVTQNWFSSAAEGEIPSGWIKLNSFRQSEPVKLPDTASCIELQRNFYCRYDVRRGAVSQRHARICVEDELRRRKNFNLLKTKHRLLYLKTQFVPRCKHFQSRL